MTDRLTKFNAETGEYEYRERAKTQAEFNAQRKAVIQRLGEFEDCAEDRARLTEENERLRAQNETLEIYNADYKFRNKELTAFNRRWAKECADLQDECEQIKSDTVRKMQTLIEEKADSCDICLINSNKPIDIIYQISKKQLDQIAKEMLEGEK